MFCPNCGVNNPDNAMHCSNCGAKLNDQPQTQPIVNTTSVEQTPPADFKHYQVLNIILTVIHFLCCSTGWFVTAFLSLPVNLIALVLSILGVVFSSQAKSAYAAGDYARALSKAKPAKLMAILSIVADLILVVIGIIGMILVFAGVGTGALAALMEDMNLMYIALR